MLQEADCWSQLPDLFHHYFSLVDREDGITRFFGYASLIDRHDPVKPQASHTLPNERARLRDMEVSMNLRTDKLYAGLEPCAGACAEGINITVLRSDRAAAVTAYIKRELGEPPWGTGIPNILENNVSAFDHVRNKPEDRLKKYKLHIVQVDIPTFDGTKKVNALAVITNADLATSLVGASPEIMAKLLSEDAQSLAYFKTDALEPARLCGMIQKRLEAIDSALAKIIFKDV